MPLLPSEGLYRLKTKRNRFLYVRGFHPAWIQDPPPEPRPLYLWSKDRRTFREITRQEQKQFLDYHLIQRDPPKPWLIVAGSVPISSALSYAAWAADRRVRRYGRQALYCINCALPLDEIDDAIDEYPILLVLHNTENGLDTARELITRYADALRFVIVPTQSPLNYAVSELRHKPDFIALF